MAWPLHAVELCMHDALRELRVGAGARVASCDFGRGPDGGSRGSEEVQTDYPLVEFTWCIGTLWRGQWECGRECIVFSTPSTSQAAAPLDTLSMK